MRAILFEPDDATALAARLWADGFGAQVVRERLAGEDDDEDHPWAVITDAPEAVLELLVDEHDGWLDTDTDRDGGAETGLGVAATHSPSTASPPPLPLPDAPRRIKRPRLG